MQLFLIALVSLIAYAGGLAILLKMTPMLLARSFDQGLFMGIAAADIIGGILAFSAILVTFALFNGTFGVKVLDFLLLVGILIVAIRLSFRSFRPRAGTFRLSRILAGGFCLLLTVAALYAMVLIVVS